MKSKGATESSDPERAPNAVFATTQWTHVLAARGESVDAKSALSNLCAAYYAPVFAFICHNGSDQEAARDLTQEFFARLLGRQGIDSVNPERGRFRSFLLGAVKHFLADMRDHASRLKRGAGQSTESLDAGTDTSPGIELADARVRNPEKEFDRKWALTVLDRAFAALANEHCDARKANQLQVLKPWLMGESAGLSQAEAAGQLGLNQGAVKVAIHRLRRRFRDLVKAEIAETLKDPSQVENELACLISALRDER